MVSDLNKHSETAGHVAMGIGMVLMAMGPMNKGRWLSSSGTSIEQR
jgi:hypothetical protein